MKSYWSKWLLAAGLALAVTLLWWLFRHDQPQKLPPQKPPASSQASNRITRMTSGSKPAASFTLEEKADLEKRFHERFKPVIDNWSKAYAGHLPFDPKDITLDKFHSIMGGMFYTFMIGDTTFTIADSKNGTKVFYFMTREAARQLNSRPDAGSPRDLTVSITREEVLRMVKADTGLDYRLDQVEIQPTAAACALNGGAFVDVGRQMENGLEVLTLNSLSFVVGADGKLITYQH